jgi:hypothetical protein
MDNAPMTIRYDLAFVCCASMGTCSFPAVCSGRGYAFGNGCSVTHSSRLFDSWSLRLSLARCGLRARAPATAMAAFLAPTCPTTAPGLAGLGSTTAA